jgi:transposase
MISVENLYCDSIEELINYKNKCKDSYSYTMLSIVINRYQGVTTNELALIYHKSVATIIDYIHKWNDLGFEALNDKRGGSKGTFTNEMLQTIKNAINNENPTEYGFESSTWTIDMFIDLIQRKFGIKYSYEWIRQVIKNNNYTYKRGQYKPTYADIKEQELFKKNARSTTLCRKFY